MMQSRSASNQSQLGKSFYLSSDKFSLLPGYSIQKVLGSGSFATVYQAIKDVKSTHSMETIVAIKAIHLKNHRLTTKVMNNLEVEIKILSKFRHRNIVALNEVHKTESHFFLVLEYCSGGDLQHLINSRKSGRLSERLVRRLMRDLSSGLKFLWDNSLIHRDIKPQNLLLTGPLPLDEQYDPPKFVADEKSRHRVDFPTWMFHLKIADFGFAKYLPNKASLADTLCGSPLYMAPEVLQQKKYDGKADLWSVGTVLFEMITGSPPFYGENQIDLLRNIQQKAVRLPQELKVSKQCIVLLRTLLCRDPAKRATFDEFYESVKSFVALGCNDGIISLHHEEKEKNYESPQIPSTIDNVKNDFMKIPNVMLEEKIALPYIIEKDFHNSRKSSNTQSSNNSHRPQSDGNLLQKERKKLIMTTEKYHPKDPNYTFIHTPSGSSSSTEIKSKCANEYSPVCLEEELNQNLYEKCAYQKKNDHGSFIMVDKLNRGKYEESNAKEDEHLHNTKQNQKIKKPQLNRLKPPIMPDLENIVKNRCKKFIQTHPNLSTMNDNDDVKSNVRDSNNVINLKALSRILEASEDVGRRAVTVARLGDERISLAVKHKLFENKKHFSCSIEIKRTKPIDSVPVTCSQIGRGYSLQIAPQHSVGENSFAGSTNAYEKVNRNHGKSLEMYYDEKDDMPFLLNTSKPIVHFQTDNRTSSFCFPTNESKRSENMYFCFVEGLLCYLKSMNLLKSSINGCVSVSNQLEIFLNESGDNIASELKSRCEVSHSWLADQFVNILERANLTNRELEEHNNGNITFMEEIKVEKYPKCVEELIYDGFLALGQNGAVKKLLAQFEIARDCFRHAGLLVETLLMEPKLAKEDRISLEKYLHEFSQCVTEVDVLIVNRSRII